MTTTTTLDLSSFITDISERPVPVARKSAFKTDTKKSDTHDAYVIADKYRERNSYRGFLAIGNNYLVISLCIAFSEWCSRSTELSPYLSTAAYAASVLIITTRMRAFENLVHEASHNNLFERKSFHESLQFLYTFPIFRVLQDYRASHLIHHKHLGDAVKDPDIQRLGELGILRMNERPLWFLVCIPASGFLTYEYLTTTFIEFWSTSASKLSKTAFWATAATAIYYADVFNQFCWYFLVPFMLLLPIARYYAELAEHTGLDLRSGLTASRSNIGWVHRWFMHPHNDGYHAVHHIHSQIPFYLLPTVHNQLMKTNDDFKNNVQISHGFVETVRQMISGETIVKE